MYANRKYLAIAWILVLPALIIRVFTTIYPIIETFRISLYEVKLLQGIREFVGFDNFIQLFQDSKVITSMGFTVIFVVGSMLGHIVLGIALALILNMKFAGQKILRTIVLLPWAMPMVVIAMASKWAFNNDYGLINDFVRWFNPNFNLDWLIHTNTARFAVIAVDLWKDLPFFAILVLAGLQFISAEMYEAAKIDGAGPIRSFFSITLPMLSRNILVLSIFFTMWRITSFDIVYAMTSGGPGESTALIAYRVTTEAFTNLNTGYAASIAVVLFLVMALLSWLSMSAAKRVDY
ncbi:MULTISPECIES: sugar ABC transporter permease [unclassified Paenibacillus]|uniref:carbohydrate ABC transporter permease n=1 Tax=unclassified Paenibacillus TaxID=185978 RepID=UPI0024070581|nr:MULTISPECIES: sugar ABC transporter permease [unclassified Paenibacillus]MDF9840590.1 multiple sugar transport system permease protein [Paenibacillus sp. PastF-2]MDF9847172.1 multiple sugar transport system permease protein [Paenibacillus sp. PastM-2]MDF9853744.1 multiple sugar transport system permease protein [Paenibacillus sp. PastF-1]MDH6478770.1 multiple sugar transport system permease protein [Paenibacillus sp. PastH-2]MDH6506502.1 multiple sugar transport system permease protein [Pae